MSAVCFCFVFTQLAHGESSGKKGICEELNLSQSSFGLCNSYINIDCREQLKHESPQCVSIRKNFLSHSGKNIDDLLMMEPPTEKRVFSEKASPDEFFTNESALVTILAEILSGNLPLSSVIAYLADANGNLLSELGQMYDDGTHGDARGADTIFTAQFDMNESSAQTMLVRVRAAYDGDQNLYLSPTIPITVYKPLPENASAEVAIVLNELEQKFLNYIAGGMDIQKATRRVLHDALSDPAVTHAEQSGNTISITFKNGIKGVVILNNPDNPSQHGRLG